VAGLISQTLEVSLSRLSSSFPLGFFGLLCRHPSLSLLLTDEYLQDRFEQVDSCEGFTVAVTAGPPSHPVPVMSPVALSSSLDGVGAAAMLHRSPSTPAVYMHPPSPQPSPAFSSPPAYASPTAPLLSSLSASSLPTLPPPTPPILSSSVPLSAIAPLAAGCPTPGLLRLYWQRLLVLPVSSMQKVLRASSVKELL
jgi:hypothetical protein